MAAVELKTVDQHDRRAHNPHHLSEIDGLRGVAVLAVLLNHYFSEFFASGFLGVDIFFVISGFVITKNLRQASYTSWTQYLSTFYARRIKRLLPALLFCVVITSVLFVELTTRPSPDVFKTGGSALVGLSNIFLFRRSTDYFSLDASLNPFTHTWSLGVEEQFYLVFPILLALTGYVQIRNLNRNKSLFALAAITGLSFFSYLVVHSISENAAFYLIPNRMWELGIGCLSYLAFEQGRRLPRIKSISILSLILISLIFVAPNTYQVITTIACVLLTAQLLLSIANDDIAKRVLTNNCLVSAGICSYSLYLWHWSILVLSRWTIGAETLIGSLFCLILVFAMTAFSYFYIERPFRYAAWTKSNFRTIFLGLAVAVIFGAADSIWAPEYGMGYNDTLSRIFDIKPVEALEEIECHGTEKTKQFKNPLEHCLGAVRTQVKPNVLYLIGDSHAAQFVYMIRKSIENLPYSLRNMEGVDFPMGLIIGNSSDEKTLSYIAENSQAGDYVVIAFHRGILNDVRDKHIEGSGDVFINQKTTTFITDISPFVKTIEAKGIRIIFVRDTPLMKVVSTSSTCALQIKLFGASICRVTKEQDLRTRYRQDFAYDELRVSFKNVFIWDPMPLIYENKNWVDVIDKNGNYIMWDWNHITQFESESLADDFRVFFESTARP